MWCRGVWTMSWLGGPLAGYPMHRISHLMAITWPSMMYDPITHGPYSWHAWPWCMRHGMGSFKPDCSFASPKPLGLGASRLISACVFPPNLRLHPISDRCCHLRIGFLFFFFAGLPVPESRANPRNFDHCVRYACSRILCFFFLLIFRCLGSRGVVLEINIREPVLYVYSGLADSLDI